MTDKLLPKEKKVQRHGFAVRFVHWTVAIATVLLLFSGFGQMPMYRRYGVYKLPGLAWSGDFSVTLSIHYWAAMILIFAVVFHVVYHVIRKEYDILPRKGDFKESLAIIKATLLKGQEPPSDKYLAEQRLVYAYMAFWFLVVIVTGMLKVLKNLPGIEFAPVVNLWNTNLHTLATMMILIGIIAHLAAFIFKVNWPLLPGIFTGKVDLEYVRHRHSIWYGKLLQKGAKPKETPQGKTLST